MRLLTHVSLVFTRQFGSIVIMALVVGMALYGTIYVIPQFLALIADYNALQTGYVIALMGLPALFLMPIVPFLITRIDIRLAVGAGLLLMAISCLITTNLTSEAGGGAFTTGQVLRGIGMIFTMLFLNQGAIAAVSKEDAGDASGIFNAARNLGGSFALAALATIQDQRLWHHSRRMEESLSANNSSVQDYLAGLQATAGNVEGPAWAGRVDEIARYCEGDVASTLLLLANQRAIETGDSVYHASLTYQFVRWVRGQGLDHLQPFTEVHDLDELLTQSLLGQFEAAFESARIDAELKEKLRLDASFTETIRY